MSAPARHAAGGASTRFETVVWAHTALDAEPARARDAVRQIVVGVLLTSREVLGDLGVTLPDALARALVGVDYGQAEAVARIAAQIPENVLAHFSLAGDGRVCLEGAARLARQGATHLAVVPWLVPGQTLEEFIVSFAREVIAPSRG